MKNLFSSVALILVVCITLAAGWNIELPRSLQHIIHSIPDKEYSKME